MMKRILSMLLALLMVVSILPAPGYAEDGNASADSAVLPVSADYSDDVGQYAVLNTAANLPFFDISFETPTTAFVDRYASVDDFSTDILFEIAAAEVVTETYTKKDVETGESTECILSSLWYRVNVVQGDALGELQDGFWILQNCLNEEYAYENPALILQDPPVADPEPTPTDKSDPDTGVVVSATLPADITLDVTPKAAAETGLGTDLIPAGRASLFYDVTLLQDGAEYQPEGGVTVTFPAAAIAESGLAAGEHYHVFHIHDGKIDMTEPALYNGGDITANFANLSIVGIAETAIPVNLYDQYGTYNKPETVDNLRMTINKDSVLLYNGYGVVVFAIELTDAEGIEITVTERITFNTTDFVMYGFEYEGSDPIFAAMASIYPYIVATDVSEPVDDSELQPTYENLMGTGSLAEFEEMFNSLSDEEKAALQASSFWAELQEHNNHLVYSHFYSVGTEAEFNAIKNQYSEAWNYIQSNETLKYYNDKHLERIRYVAEHPVIELELSDEVISVPLPSYTNAAGLMQTPTAPISAASNDAASPFRLLNLLTHRNTSSAPRDVNLAADGNNNGVALGKAVYDNNDGTYTVRLEAYTTGSKVTTVTTKQLPADIILVLDLSNSMTMYKMTGVAYQAVTSGTAGELALNYGTKEAVTVLVGDTYVPVTITGVGDAESREIYAVYEEVTSNFGYYQTSNYQASTLYTYITQNENNGNALYYKDNEGNYHKVTAKENGSNGGYPGYPGYGSTYTFSYYNSGTSGATTEIVSDVNAYSTVNSSTYTFYTKTSGTAYDSYTFTYDGEDGQVTKTYNYDDSIGVGTTPTYYVVSAGGEVSRAEALESAVTNFANQVAIKAKGSDGAVGGGDDIAHSVAIVGYSGSGQPNTGVYIGSTIDTYNDGVSTETYANALQDMSTTTGVNNINASINALRNTQGTYTYCGTEMALGILRAQPASRYVNDKGETIRTKVVIVFTDGAPSNGRTNTTNSDYNDPISDTYKIKNECGATVYTVGVLDGGSVTPIQPESNLNKFMHYMSSNYKNATSLNNSGDFTNEQYAVDGSSYYLLASNANDLNNIFTSIQSSATSGGSITELSTSTQIRDIISPYFKMPEGATTSSIKLYTADYTEANTWSTATEFKNGTVAISEDGKTIGVTGFNYKEHWVGTETDSSGVKYRGRKLIIEFPIVMEEDFLGGNGVDTNGDTSGIYADTNATDPIETFEVPHVDVALKDITNVANDKHIYLSNTVNLTDILDLYVDVNSDGIKDLQIVADGVNNDYVTLAYEVTLADQTVYTYTVPAGATWSEGTWTNLAGDTINMSAVELTADTVYSVTCNMSTYPVLDGADASRNQTKTASSSATIYVYKPVLTFQDAVKTPNVDSVSFETENYVSTVWKHNETVAGEQMDGEVPVLTLTYTPDADCVNGSGLVISNRDFHVNVAVTVNDENITGATTFVHANCDHAGCSFNANSGEFMIHMDTTDLTITKSGWQSIDENQTFIFDVTGPNGFEITVTINGNGSVTIKDLPIGTYYVTEQTEWSWRYTPVGGTEEITLKADPTQNVVSFVNTRNIIYWLSGDNVNENQFTVKPKTQE